MKQIKYLQYCETCVSTGTLDGLLAIIMGAAVVVVADPRGIMGARPAETMGVGLLETITLVLVDLVARGLMVLQAMTLDGLLLGMFGPR